MVQPKTIASEINENIELLLGSGLQYTQENDLLIKLERQSKNLSKVNLADGYLALSAASMLTGDFNKMRERYEIAKNQGLTSGQRINYVTTLSHAGFFTEAATILKGAHSTFSDHFFAAIKALLCFQFQIFIEVFDKAISQNLTPSKEDIEMRETIGNVIKISDIDDPALAKLADLAGEVMREHHIYFKNFPTLRFCLNDDGVDFVIASFPVPVSFEDASEMTLAFAEKVFTRGLANDKFLVRFSGQA
jgi:hypothetical protein